MVDALRAGFDGNVEVFSTAPLVDFPHSRLLFGPRAKWMIDDQINATMAPFLNLPGLKHFTRFMATSVFVSRWILKNRDSKRIIILLGVQSCKLWGVLFAQIFGPCITVSYLTDDLGIALKVGKILVEENASYGCQSHETGITKSSRVLLP